MSSSTTGLIIGAVAAIVGQTFVGIAMAVKRYISVNGAKNMKSFTSRLKDYRFWVATFMLLIGELSNFMGYFFIPAYVMVLLGAINVLVSQICSALILREYISSMQVIGTVLISAGVILILVITPRSPSDIQINTFADSSIRWMDPIPMVMVVSAAIVIIVLVFIMIQIYRIQRSARSADPALQESQTWITLVVYALSGSLSVITTKGVGILLYEAVVAKHTNFHNPMAYFIWPFWSIFIVGQVWLVNLLLHARDLSIMAPLMYASYSLCGTVSSLVYYRELGNDTFVELLFTLSGIIMLMSGVWFVMQQYPKFYGFFPLCCPKTQRIVTRPNLDLSSEEKQFPDRFEDALLTTDDDVDNNNNHSNDSQSSMDNVNL